MGKCEQMTFNPRKNLPQVDCCSLYETPIPPKRYASCPSVTQHAPFLDPGNIGGEYEPKITSTFSLVENTISVVKIVFPYSQVHEFVENEKLQMSFR
jgi:hypothetical protein